MTEDPVVDVVGEIVREKTKEKGGCTRDVLEAEIQQLRGIAEDRRANGRINFAEKGNHQWLSWKIIHAREDKAYIHVEDDRGNRIEAGKNGSLTGNLKKMEFNTERYNIGEELIDLSNFKDSSKSLPQQVKQDLDAIYENSENNRGSFTRLFGLKCFFDLDEEKVKDSELREAVKRRYKASMPGTKSSYMSYRGKAFTSEKYSSFIEEDGYYRIDSEFEDSRAEIRQYVYDLWNKVDDNPDYFMVLQKREDELENEYLEASADDSEPSHYLEKLSEGDIVIHYFSPDKKVIGCSEVVEEAYEYSEDELRVGVNLHTFDEEISRDDIIPKLKDERGKLDKYYVLNKSGDLNEGYLFEITEEAAKYIQNGAQGQDSENYFWVTADPSIWEVPELEEGDQKFYPAYLPSGNKARIFSNFEKASKGDRVIFYQSTPVKKVVAEGVVSEGLHEEEVEGYDNTVEGITLEYIRAIEGNISWSKLTDIPDLEGSKPIINTAQGSIFKLDKEEFETILSLENPEPSEEKLADYIQAPRFNVNIPKDLYFENEDDLKNEISASLNSGKNIIFTGPPGTGKTKLAKSISEQVSEEDSENSVDEVEGSLFTTATADWTAFDTIGGYMPSQNDGEELEFNPGQFLKCFRKENGEVTNKWLVIDEINRSDIDKAFGQLFSVLSGDSVELPYRKDGHVKLEKVESDENVEEIERDEDVYPITDSWRLIATMNTYDKTSLYDMSYAFMRRFNFIHVGVPELETEEGYNYDLLDPEEEDNYASVWDVRETLAEGSLYRELTVLWAEVNNQRDIGPSIIKDIIEFIDAHSGERDTALAQAVNSLILLQFEGLRREKQEQFIKELNNHSEEGSISINDSLVEEKALNMFSISLDDE